MPIELTKEQEDAVAMEMAKEHFMKELRKALSGVPTSDGTFYAIEHSFETGFKLGLSWRDEP